MIRVSTPILVATAALFVLPGCQSRDDLNNANDDTPVLGLAGGGPLLQAAGPAVRRIQRSTGSQPTAQRSRGGLTSVRLEGVPHVRQKPDFCGEACVEMWLRKLGYATIDQDRFFAAAGVDPTLGRGAVAKEMAQGLRRIGLAPGRVWYHVRANRPAAGLARQFRIMHADLRAGVPSIVCTRFDESPRTTEHFRLVVGYDAGTDEVIYHDPALDRGGYLRMKRRRLLGLWPLKYRKDRWLVIRMPLKVKGPVAAARRYAGRFTAADYAQHVRKLRPKLRRLSGRFTVVIQPPFVVVGDEWSGRVKKRAKGTVKWATDMLKRDYFAKDPSRILTVWLFKDRRSYLRNTMALFNQRPGTPYGFYSDHHNALVMNIATGGGTLVHEIVHPFMEANFPACPPWFNEGLGSLYEQSGRKGDKIWGFTNWRLPGLQKAIAAKRVPTFRNLTSRTTRQFYNQDPGTNYAQSRYLLHYLQHKGLLRRYYREFVANQRTDPSGYATLKRILGVRDMVAFQRGWETYVVGLRFR
jgi:hypothetical protein